MESEIFLPFLMRPCANTSRKNRRWGLLFPRCLCIFRRKRRSVPWRKKAQARRDLAVSRYLAGEPVRDICHSLGCSTSWLYKWLSRYQATDPHWQEAHSRRPQHHPRQTPEEIEQVVQQIRQELSTQGLFCGAQAILWEMESLSIHPRPSERTINRILRRQGLTQRRSERYQPKGKSYPRLEGTRVNRVHQMDFVGPRYLRNPTRFYSLHAVDLASSRCAIEPMTQRGGQRGVTAVWAIWQRLGLPDHLQVDNEMVFYGSPTHPRGMGSLIRLCLHHHIQLWFIPPGEPWRNGVVEKFNDHYQQKFLDRVDLPDEGALRQQSRAFEQRHNASYRYSKLGGKTPSQILAQSPKKLRFPLSEEPPRYPLSKPKRGKYHLVRFIRSDALLNVFGETFPLPPETVYEYVIATVDVAQQKITIFLDKEPVEEIDYPLF